jgi:hypothetical protein
VPVGTVRTTISENRVHDQPRASTLPSASSPDAPAAWLGVVGAHHITASPCGAAAAVPTRSETPTIASVHSKPSACDRPRHAYEDHRPDREQHARGDDEGVNPSLRLSRAPS